MIHFTRSQRVKVFSQLSLDRFQIMGIVNKIRARMGQRLADVLVKESSGYRPYTPSDFDTLWTTLQPGDILLVEGNQHVSAAIKYLTQSTWSHAAFYVGHVLPRPSRDENGTRPERPRLIEVTLGQGCIATPLSRYQSFNTRICRPVGLSPEDQRKVVEFMISKIGLKYDLRNIFDLLRYFIPTPPVPVSWRRKMLAFGSGDATMAICSSLIAQAYQSIDYPILPEVTLAPGRVAAKSSYSKSEILHIRHHSLFAPRDFDLSPYFEVVKPSLQSGFDYKDLSFSGKTSSRDILRDKKTKQIGTQD